MNEDIKSLSTYITLVSRHGEILIEEEAEEYAKNNGVAIGLKNLETKFGLKRYSTSTVTYRAVDLVRAVQNAKKS